MRWGCSLYQTAENRDRVDVEMRSGCSEIGAPCALTDKTSFRIVAIAPTASGDTQPHVRRSFAASPRTWIEPERVESAEAYDRVRLTTPHGRRDVNEMHNARGNHHAARTHQVRSDSEKLARR